MKPGIRTDVVLQTMTRMKRFAVYQLPIIIYAGIAFALSSIHKLPTPDLGFDYLDKLIHMAEYFVFMILAFRALTGSAPRSKGLSVYIIAAAISIAFAFSDEYHQSFVPGRHADFYDVVADSAGVLLAGIFLFFFHSRRRYAS